MREPTAGNQTNTADIADSDVPLATIPITRALTVSGYLGLAVVMGLGLYQDYLYAIDQAPPLPFWLVDGYTQLAMLSLVALVIGGTIETLSVSERLRRVVISLIVIGQWLLPIISWVAFPTGILSLNALVFVGWPCLLVAMLLMAWRAATGGSDRTDIRSPG